MVKKVTSYKILTVFAAAAVITLTAVGYWFADEKSEQVYLSKIDRLMFAEICVDSAEAGKAERRQPGAGFF